MFKIQCLKRQSHNIFLTIFILQYFVYQMDLNYQIEKIIQTNGKSQDWLVLIEQLKCNKIDHARYFHVSPIIPSILQQSHSQISLQEYQFCFNVMEHISPLQLPAEDIGLEIKRKVSKPVIMRLSFPIQRDRQKDNNSLFTDYFKYTLWH